MLTFNKSGECGILIGSACEPVFCRFLICGIILALADIAAVVYCLSGGLLAGGESRANPDVGRNAKRRKQTT